MVKPMLVLVLLLSVTNGQSLTNELSDSSDAISVLQHTVAELSRQMDGLKRSHKQEMETVAHLQEALNSVKGENKHLKARVAVLESRMAANIEDSKEDQQYKGFPDYSNESHPPGESKTNVTTTVRDVLMGLPSEAAPRVVTGTKRDGRSRMSRVPGTNRNAVAFYAFLTHNVADPGDDFTVKNDHQVTNLGGGYNPASGIFTCPKAGVYVFSWSIGVATNGQVYSELTTNGASVGYLWTGEHTWAESSEKTLILELRQGDIITIRVARTGDTSPSLWGLRTSFSGYLIPY